MFWNSISSISISSIRDNFYKTVLEMVVLYLPANFTKDKHRMLAFKLFNIINIHSFLNVPNWAAKIHTWEHSLN